MHVAVALSVKFKFINDTAVAAISVPSLLKSSGSVGIRNSRCIQEALDRRRTSLREPEPISLIEGLEIVRPGDEVSDPDVVPVAAVEVEGRAN